MADSRTLERYDVLGSTLRDLRLGDLNIQELIAEYDDEEFCEMTGVYYDPRCLLHEDGEGESVERPARAEEIFEGLKKTGLLKKCRRVPGRRATKEEICSVHTAPYYRLIEDTQYRSAGRSRLRSSIQQNIHLDEEKDTYINDYSFDAACLSTGGLLQVAERVVDGRLKNGFAIIRPPGHHAENCKAMGFCLFNHVAICAQMLLQRYPEDVKKIMIVDWDVHHGNGTEKTFEADPRVLYFSIHRYDNGSFFPGTGKVTSVGKGRGAGKTVNVPLPSAGFGDTEYLQIFLQVLLPIAREFEPDLLLVSAGFDSALGDIGEMKVTENGFGQMMSMLKNTGIVDEEKIVVALEGGYNISSLVSSSLEVVKVLLGGFAPSIPPIQRVMKFFTWTEKKHYQANLKRFTDVVARVLTEQSRFWHCFRSLLPSEGRQTRQSALSLSLSSTSMMTGRGLLPQVRGKNSNLNIFKSHVRDTTHPSYPGFLGKKVYRIHKGVKIKGTIVDRVYEQNRNRWGILYEDGEYKRMSHVQMLKVKVITTDDDVSRRIQDGPASTSQVEDNADEKKNDDGGDAGTAAAGGGGGGEEEEEKEQEKEEGKGKGEEGSKPAFSLSPPISAAASAAQMPDQAAKGVDGEGGGGESCPLLVKCELVEKHQHHQQQQQEGEENHQQQQQQQQNQAQNGDGVKSKSDFDNDDDDDDDDGDNHEDEQNHSSTTTSSTSSSSSMNTSSGSQNNSTNIITRKRARSCDSSSSSAFIVKKALLPPPSANSSSGEAAAASAADPPFGEGGEKKEVGSDDSKSSTAISVEAGQLSKLSSSSVKKIKRHSDMEEEREEEEEEEEEKQKDRVRREYHDAHDGSGDGGEDGGGGRGRGASESPHHPSHPPRPPPPPPPPPPCPDATSSTRSSKRHRRGRRRRRQQPHQQDIPALEYDNPDLQALIATKRRRKMKKKKKKKQKKERRAPSRHSVNQKPQEEKKVT